MEEVVRVNALQVPTSHSYGRVVGFLEVIVGPMFSGKTSRLLIELARFADTNHSVLYICHSSDVRTDVVSNTGRFTCHNSFLKCLPDNISFIYAQELKSVNIDKYDVVGIDECQFFPDLRDTVVEWVDAKAKYIIAAGLDGDYRRQNFGQTHLLLPNADVFVKVNGVCMKCLEESRSRGILRSTHTLAAPFTFRTSSSSETILIGGEEHYKAVCREHYSLRH